MATNEIVKVNNTAIISTFDEAERAAKAMASSDFFQDARTASQAVVKILAGQELGFGPFASMTGVAIIQGKPAIGANLQAAAIKRTGKYNYRVIDLTDQVAEIEFYEGGKVAGRSKFTMTDAAAAGLAGKDNWKKFPRNMLFARAISNGVRWFAPDIFNGATVYTPDELGVSEDENGNVIDVTPVTVTHAEPEPEQKQEPAQITESAQEHTNVKMTRPYTADSLKAGLLKAAQKNDGATASDKQVNLTAAMLDMALMDEGKNARHTVTKWVFGKPSLKTMTGAEVKALLDWLKPTQVDGDYQPGQHVTTEAKNVYRAALIAEGQAELI